jgi:hypothetical protein
MVNIRSVLRNVKNSNITIRKEEDLFPPVTHLQWNPLKKFSRLRCHNNLLPKFTHMMNTDIALLTSFPLTGISSLWSMTSSWPNDVLSIYYGFSTKIANNSPEFLIVQFFPNTWRRKNHPVTRGDKITTPRSSRLIILLMSNGPQRYRYAKLRKSVNTSQEMTLQTNCSAIARG